MNHYDIRCCLGLNQCSAAATTKYYIAWYIVNSLSPQRGNAPRVCMCRYTIASNGTPPSSTNTPTYPPPVAPTYQQHDSYGLLFAGQAWLTALLMFPLCFLAALVAPIFDWRRMRPPTLVALLWGRMAMWNMGVRPKVEGLELLPPKDEAVVFVANHGSYLDIPVSNFLPRLCKV